MAVERTIARDDVALHVPALCDIEVAAVVRRALLARRVREDRAAEAVADYLDLPITRHGHAGFIARVLQLRQNFSAYDGVYVALAEAPRRGTSWTCDDRPAAGRSRLIHRSFSASTGRARGRPWAAGRSRSRRPRDSAHSDQLTVRRGGASPWPTTGGEAVPEPRSPTMLQSRIRRRALRPSAFAALAPGNNARTLGPTFGRTEEQRRRRRGQRQRSRTPTDPSRAVRRHPAHVLPFGHQLRPIANLRADQRRDRTQMLVRFCNRIGDTDCRARRGRLHVIVSPEHGVQRLRRRPQPLDKVLPQPERDELARRARDRIGQGVGSPTTSCVAEPSGLGALIFEGSEASARGWRRSQ